MTENLTIEQKAWQLHENGVEYGDIATEALMFEISMDEAIEQIWLRKLGQA
jgi:hypothetical protein